MNKRILTLEQLVQFFEKSNLQNFSAKESGYSLAVQVPSTLLPFKKEEYVDDSLMYAKIKILHTGINRNGSNVTQESLDKALKTLAYKPILANFTTLDSGDEDFTSHDFEYDDDGNITYFEKQVGAFTADKPYMEEDENGKNFCIGIAAIPREYTHTASIIERKGYTKVSVELNVNAVSFDTENKCLNLDDFIISGLTLLGTNPDTGEEVQEGMQGARLDIMDFSTEKNSIVSNFADNEQLIRIMQELKESLDNYTKSTNAQKNEGKEDFNVDEETKIIEEVTEESTEEVTAETEEVSEETLEDTPTEEETVVELESLTRTFEVSHEDVRYALYQLISQYEELDGDFYFINSVFDSHFIFEGWSGNIWGQKYTKDGDNIALDGERYALHAEYLTDSELAELNAMRENYSSIKSKLAKYEAAELEANRLEVLNSSEYTSINNKEEYQALVEKHDFTLDELRVKLDAIVLEYAKKGALQFAKTPVEKSKTTIVRLPINDKKSSKRSRYGNLFS